MENKFKSLTLKSIDYGENDKLITALSEDGKILTIKARGVKKSSAKMKFACQPFCLMETVVHTNGDFSTLIGASPIYQFVEIMGSLERMNAGFVALETALRLCGKENDIDWLTFILKFLEKLSFCEVSDISINLCVFLANVLKLTGYTPEFERCVTCGKAIKSESVMCIDIGGGMKCEDCISYGNKKIRLSTYIALKNVFENKLDKLELSDNIQGLAPTILKILKSIFGIKYDFALNSLDSYIKQL